MPYILAFPPRPTGKLLLLASALTLSLPLAGAGCADKACLQLTATTTGGGGMGGAGGAATTGGGGMGGAGGAAPAGGGGTAGSGGTGPSCPGLEGAKAGLEEARARLGTPSCAEEIVSVDKLIERDGNVCCYEVTTKSTACAGEGAR